MKNKCLIIVALLIALVLSPMNVLWAADDEADSDYDVYVSTYALESFTDTLAGDFVNVHNFVPLDADLHTWEPTARDMAALSDADLLLVNGAGFESWLDKVAGVIDEDKIVDTSKDVELLPSVFAESKDHADADDEHADDEHAIAADEDEHADDEQAEAAKKDDHAEAKLDSEQAKDVNQTEQTTEQATEQAKDVQEDKQAKDDHADKHDADKEHAAEAHDEHDEAEHEEHHHHHGAFDPHFWTDPYEAEKQAKAVYEALVELVPDHKEELDTRFAEMQDKFAKLQEKADELPKGGSFVVTHGGFRYLADRYDLQQLALSFGDHSEPSPQQVARIIDQAKELGVKVVLYDQMESPKQAKVIADAIDAEVKPIQTFEQVSKEEREDGRDYFERMEEMLGQLKEAIVVKE